MSQPHGSVASGAASEGVFALRRSEPGQTRPAAVGLFFAVVSARATESLPASAVPARHQAPTLGACLPGVDCGYR